MIRPLAISLFAAFAASGALAAPPSFPLEDAATNLAPPDLQGKFMNVDMEGNADATGEVRVQQGPLLLTADRMHWARRTNTLICDGHVILTDRDQRLLADHLEYHRTTGTFAARIIRIGRYPVYIQGGSAEGDTHEITIHDAVVSYTDPGAWKPSIKARTIIYSPGHYLRSVRSLVGLNGAEFLPVGSFRQSLNEAVSAQILTFDVGYRSSLGGILDVGFHEPVFPGGSFGGNVSEYTKRGVMMGPTGKYADPDGSGDWSGFLRTGWIEDHGNRADNLQPQGPLLNGTTPVITGPLDPRGYDLLDQPVPRSRYYVAWQHTQSIGDNWTANGQINWWGDADVVRDFRPKEFFPVQTPDNDFEVLYSGDNDFASAFARFRPNAFEDVQERLPEISYVLTPIAIGGGFYERGQASAVSLLERPPLGGAELTSTRLDAYYSVTRPIAPTDWLDFTPVAGARVTDYLNTQGAVTDGHFLRTLGEVGFDAQARASGVFAYQNPTWDIDGLRHLITPSLSYRYIPGTNTGSTRIPAIDRQTFSTYLQPLELGDARAIDDLAPLNTLRLGVDNILQTRNAGYGSRNLIELDVADDLNFKRTGNEPDFSDVHTEFALTPANWLELDAAHIFDPRTLTLREFDGGITLKDGDQWRLRFAGDFLRHEDDDYLLEYSQRINEQYTAVLLLEYGARQHVFNTREIGIVQNLANTWRIQYLLTLNGGPNREGRLGFNVELSVLRF